ncbi:transcription factor 25-like [Salvia divinorum]|uniref:Transcription factor 25-like n=1 Tax=Salvia divinorum TaxID=28513 RepID=A0ABD1IMH1_SALDI
MSSRLMKKVLNEQSAALQLQQFHSDGDDDSESPQSSAPARNLFSLLEDDDDDIGTDQEQGKDANETSDRDIAPSSEMAAPHTRNVNSKKKKNKKKKNSNKVNLSLVNHTGSSNLNLDSLSLIDGHQETRSPAKNKLLNADADAKLLRKPFKTRVLEVDPKFLSAENELRRIFGSRVVKSHDRNSSSANPRLMRGGRRGTHNLKKTIIISPSQHWPRWDGSLTMELLNTLEGIHYFRYTHSSSYAQAQRAFESAKENHDLNGIANVLLNHPYHIDSLTTLADYFKFTGEHQMSADATAKCLYALECAWHPLFTPSRNCQLKYDHDLNKPLFSALFTHMKNMDKRGCHRSALEICKLLLSLDSNDPVGAMFCIDYYALRAEEHGWLEQFAEEYQSDNSLWLFPNFSYSLAICRLCLESNEVLGGGETDVGKATSFELMKQALMLHPSVLKKLVVKVPLNDRKWTSVVKHRFFRSEETGSPSLDHLIAIYIEKSYIIWRLPDLQKLLYDSAISLIEMLEKKESDVNDWVCVRKEAFSSEKNEYSHLLVSEFSDSVPTMPPENLQDFIVDQRGGIELPEQIPENHALRDVANRSPLAVLFESILPWINYGTGDGEDEHNLPGPADED